MQMFINILWFHIIYIYQTSMYMYIDKHVHIYYAYGLILEPPVTNHLSSSSNYLYLPDPKDGSLYMSGPLNDRLQVCRDYINSLLIHY